MRTCNHESTKFLRGINSCAHGNNSLLLACFFCITRGSFRVKRRCLLCDQFFLCHENSGAQRTVVVQGVLAQENCPDAPKGLRHPGLSAHGLLHHCRYVRHFCVTLRSCGCACVQMHTWNCVTNFKSTGFHLVACILAHEIASMN